MLAYHRQPYCQLQSYRGLVSFLHYSSRQLDQRRYRQFRLLDQQRCQPRG